MPPSFSHAFPDSGSLEAVVKTIHVSLVTVKTVVFQHASCASTWVFEFVAFAGMWGHASLPRFVVGREYGNIFSTSGVGFLRLQFGHFFLHHKEGPEFCGL